MGGGGHSQPVSGIAANTIPAAVTDASIAGCETHNTSCPESRNVWAVLSIPPQSRCPGSGAVTNQNDAMHTPITRWKDYTALASRCDYPANIIPTPTVPGPVWTPTAVQAVVLTKTSGLSLL